MTKYKQSNVSSEDWARKYRYDEIIWSNNPSETTQSIDTLTALARAAAHDAMAGKKTTLCTVGGRMCGKTRMMFGEEISRCVALEREANENADGKQGLLGQILEILVRSGSHLKCFLSIVEVVDEDILRDVLGFSYHDLNQQDGHALRLRHFDQRGAVLENLHPIPLDGDTLNEVIDAFNNEQLKKIWSKEGGHGHFITTVTLEGGGMIQLVDCASSDRPYVTFPKSDDAAWKQKHDRRMNSIRKSLSSLRGVFRALVLAQDVNESISSSNSPSVSFRECTLTQLLQRCLYTSNGDEKSRAVVIGAVSPSSKSYIQTLSTMDFTNRLLTRQWNTASDPFSNLMGGDKKSYDRASFKNSALASVLPMENEEDDAPFGQNNSFHSFTHHTPLIKSRPSTAGSRSVGPTDGTILKSIVSDPRQRLAKLLSTASIVKKSNNEAASENYAVDTPSSVASEDLRAEFQKKYDTVFDQLDTLMSADEDDIDKRSYGNSLIEALSEKKPSNGGMGPMQEDLSAKELFSPEVNSWSHEMPRSRPLVSTPDANRDGYFGHAPRSESMMHRRGEENSGARPSQNIPSVVVCDDDSCRDTVISDRGMDYGTLDQTPNGRKNEIYGSTTTDQSPHVQDAEASVSSSDNEIKALQTQLEEFMADNNSPTRTTDCFNEAFDAQAAPSANEDLSQMDSNPSSDVASTESEHRIIQALQSQMEQVMMESDISHCSSEIIVEDTNKDLASSKQDIFVKSASSKLLPLNMLLSTDSMDSEPLLSCRSHATQIYGSLRASQGANDDFQLPNDTNSNKDCNEQCAYFQRGDDASNLSDPLDLNHMMATFEKEIDTLMHSDESIGTVNKKIISDAGQPMNQLPKAFREATGQNISSSDSHNSCSNSNNIVVPSNKTSGYEEACVKEKNKASIAARPQAVHSTTQTDVIGNELASLKNRIQSLSESNAISESFIQRIESIVHEEKTVSFDSQNLTSSMRLSDLETTITRNYALVEELRAALSDNEAKLEAACKATQDAERQLEDKRIKSDTEIGAFGLFLGEMHELLQSSSQSLPPPVSAESQQRSCIKCIKDLKTQLQNVLKQNQDYLAEVDSLRSAITHKTSECVESQALAEQAQSMNESLSNELSVLKNKVSELQEDIQNLTTQLNEMRVQKDRVFEDLHDATQALSLRDAEVLKLKSYVQSSDQKLKSFSAKTAEVMKIRIEELRAHHATKLSSLNDTISAQNLRIQQLEECAGVESELAELKSQLSRSNAERINMEERIKQIEKSSSLKLRNISEQLLKTQHDLTAANEDSSKHQSENKSLKVELAHLRDVMSIAEESVGELQRLRQENEYLQRSLHNQRGHAPLSTSFESRGRHSVDSIGLDEDRFVHERISALMRENEHSNISMRTLQKENAALKDSIGVCHNEMYAMRQEMKDLRLLTTARKSSPISEATNTTYAAASMTTPLEHRHSHRPEYYFPFASSTLQTEDTSFTEGHLVAQLSAEKELRYKAEDICAGVLANTQAGYEKRDAEIKKLRAKLFKLSSAKY
jgi:hypothetical protein